MSKTLTLYAVWLISAVMAFAGETTLWYGQPAGNWEQALPIGNGRLGAMVFGSAPNEILQLNEESLWAGEPFDVYPDNFAENLRIMQNLVLEGKIAEAHDFGRENLTKSPTSFRSYQPLADLLINLDHSGDVLEYRRKLNMQTGIAAVQYRVGNIRFKREVLISAVDDVLAIKLSADRRSALTLTIGLARHKDMTVKTAGIYGLKMDGQIIDIPASEGGYDDNGGGSGPGGKHMRFAGRLLIRLYGGTARTENNNLIIENADDVLILFTAATDFSLEKMNFDRALEPGSVAENILEKAAQKSWEQIRDDHVREHESLFGRVSIELGNNGREIWPLDQRLNRAAGGDEDPGLAELYFQFGRYLLMSSSRYPGRLPANLQGIWNKEMWAPWESDYHLDINLQMNYWPADLCNLSETITPLTNWFEQVTRKGKISAEKLYGADGWVAFVTVDLFGRTTPGGSTLTSQFLNGVLDPLAGAWMAMTFWEHFNFTRDKIYLQDDAYPMLRGASAFILDYLVEKPDGTLAIIPSTSPENSYIDPGSGKTVWITQGSTYHNTLVREIFTATISASQLLESDTLFRGKLAAALEKVPAPVIGIDGTIREWHRDFEEAEPGHRHMSHLLGLHPFDQITAATPELFHAARAAVERRLQHGGGHTGWSRAWIINFYARLMDGGEAYRHLQLLLQKSTLPNLFNTHPPFQIDGNFGGTAGIAEMLLRSDSDHLYLLPALPPAWQNGHINGLKARGGFIVDITWQNARLTRAKIKSEAGHVCRLITSLPVNVYAGGQPLPDISVENDGLRFDTVSGEYYEIIVK